MSRYISALVLATLTAFSSLAAQAQGNLRAPAFRPDPSWPAIPNNWILGEVSSIAVDAQDHIFVLHRPATVPEAQRPKAAPPLLEFNTAGKFVAGWGGAGSGYEWPQREHGVYVDPRG